MTIILAICIPITAIVVGYFTLKAVQLGLRWQIETKQQQLPTMDAPISNLDIMMRGYKVDGKTMDDSLLDEWINGPKKKEGE